MSVRKLTNAEIVDAIFAEHPKRMPSPPCRYPVISGAYPQWWTSLPSKIRDTLSPNGKAPQATHLNEYDTLEEYLADCGLDLHLRVNHLLNPDPRQVKPFRGFKKRAKATTLVA